MQAAGVELNESFPFSSALAQRKLFRFMKSKVSVIKVVIETSSDFFLSTKSPLSLF